MEKTLGKSVEAGVQVDIDAMAANAMTSFNSLPDEIILKIFAMAEPKIFAMAENDPALKCYHHDSRHLREARL